MNLFKSYLPLCITALAAITACTGRTDRQERPDGAFVENLQGRDSILIADRVRYGFRLNAVPAGTEVLLPQWNAAAVPEVEVVRDWALDTLKCGRDKACDVEGSIVLTSFEDGLRTLPPIVISTTSPDGVKDTLAFEQQYMDVFEMPVDTASFTPHDIKGQINYPVTAGEVLPWTGVGLLGALIVAAAVYFGIRYKRRKIEEILHRDPAHIVALRELDKFRGDRLWAPEKQKAFYSGVTDALRNYVESRYGINAMEMTTAEMFDGLSRDEIGHELYDELRLLFDEADFVKFAKHTVDKETLAGAVPLAVRFVTQTYQEEVEKEVK